MGYDCLENLREEDYRYPGEKSAFDALKKIPILDKLMGAYLKYATQIWVVPEQQGDFYRVTEKTSPELYKLYKIALKRLDISEEYPLYVKAQYDYNAISYDGNAPCIVLNSSFVKNYTEQELLFIIGHELGHVKSKHTIYENMAAAIPQLIEEVPFAGKLLASAGVQYAIFHWQRMHEYSADRAGVIAAGNIEDGCNGLAKSLGVIEENPYVKFDLEDFAQQNTSFEELQEDLLGKLLCTFYIMESTHPWTISRIQKLKEWKESGEYEKFLQKYKVSR